MIKKVFISGVLGIALLTFPILTFAEEAEPPVISTASEIEAAIPEPVAPEPTEPESPTTDVVTEESCEPVTPSAVEDSSIYGNPSMDENLILTSVVGVPDELRVIFSLDGQEVAVVQGNQILRSEAFPQDQKIFLQIRIEGQGRLMGARFGFEPFTTPVILPELLELPVETPELENPEENTDSAEADNTEPGTSAEDTTESVETVEPENPTEITPEDPVINNDIDTAEPGTEPAEEDLDNTEPTEDNTADETGPVEEESVVEEDITEPIEENEVTESENTEANNDKATEDSTVEADTEGADTDSTTETTNEVVTDEPENSTTDDEESTTEEQD